MLYQINLEGKQKEFIEEIKKGNTERVNNQRWKITIGQYSNIGVRNGEIMFKRNFNELLGIYLDPSQYSESFHYYFLIGGDYICDSHVMLKPGKIINPFTPYFLDITPLYDHRVTVQTPGKRITLKITTIQLVLKNIVNINRLAHLPGIKPLIFHRASWYKNTNISAVCWYINASGMGGATYFKDNKINEWTDSTYNYKVDTTSLKLYSRLKKIVSRIEYNYLFPKISVIEDILKNNFGIYLPNEILDLIIYHFPRRNSNPFG